MYRLAMVLTPIPVAPVTLNVLAHLRDVAEQSI